MQRLDRVTRLIRRRPLQVSIAAVLVGAGLTSAFLAPLSPTSYTGCGYGFTGTGYANGYGTCPPPSSPTTTAPTSPSKTATGTNPSVSESGTTVTASGSGTITVTDYGTSNPVGSPNFSSTGAYIDVKVGTGSSFTSVNVTDCNMSGGNTIYWWNGSAWEPVAPQSYSPSTGCVTTTITSSTSPTIAELTGTVFGAGSRTAPGAPSNLVASATKGQVSLSWSAPASDGGSPITSYLVVPYVGSTAGTVIDTASSSTSYTVMGLTSGTTYTFTVAAVNAIGTGPASAPSNAVTPQVPTVPLAVTGYRLVASDGGLFSFHAPFYGSMGGIPLNKPVVGMAADPATGGYWEVAADGGIFSFHAPFYGSTGAIHLNQPIVAMLSDPTGSGYWLIARDGGVFAFGGAPFYGSLPGIGVTPAGPIVAAVSNDGGNAYGLVAANGEVYIFAPHFHTTVPSPVAHLAAPIVGAALSPGGGYWLVGADGGIFALGGAPFYGSMGGIPLNKPVVGMAADPATGGYWEVAADGGIFSFHAPFEGSMGGIPLNKPVVGMAAAQSGS
ncbi:MAG: fibronectin type III domain-containing protein [Acidimicrobiales bacterium]